MTDSASLPKAGPAWAGSLMGTSIAATLTQTHGVPVLPGVLLVVATGIAVVICGGWIMWREPPFTRDSMSAWGMLAMGILALGSAWTAVTGSDVWQLMAWWIGVILGITVCLIQLGGFPGSPVFTWGLALVAPMVAATSGAQLAEHGQIYHTVGMACFFLSLLTAVPTFVRVYAAVLRGDLELEPEVAGTAWIPLGIVGQSTAAAQLLFGGSGAVVYGVIMLLMGIPLVIYAMSRFYPAVAAWAPYSPGWWGSTFPVGTLSMGTHELARATGAAWLDWVSVAFVVLLLIHWSICVLRWLSWQSDVSQSRSESPRRAEQFSSPRAGR